MQLTFNLTSNNFAKDIYLIIYTAFDVSANFCHYGLFSLKFIFFFKNVFICIFNMSTLWLKSVGLFKCLNFIIHFWLC